ncbi:MAG: type II toxin-antitoxin system HipA family toxin, partial [Brachymonas sp.]|nr:type II toxin-antitoxin system HipA family toxin [Brachymonas sp.]
GKRMLLAWQEGVASLRDRRMYALGDWAAATGFAEFSPPAKQTVLRHKIGHSQLLGRR